MRETLGFKSDLLDRGPFGEAFHPEPLTTVGPGFQSDWMTNMWNRGGGAAEGRAGGAGTSGRGGGPGGRGGAEAGGEEQPPLRRAMDVNPKLRVMSMKGMYDGSCAAMDEAVTRAEPHLKSRITNHAMSAVTGSTAICRLAGKRNATSPSSCARRWRHGGPRCRRAGPRRAFQYDCLFVRRVDSGRPVPQPPR